MCPQPGWLWGGCLGLLRATKPRLLKQVQPSSAPVGAGAGAASACLPHCVNMAQSTEPASLTQRLAPTPFAPAAQVGVKDTEGLDCPLWKYVNTLPSSPTLGLYFITILVIIESLTCKIMRCK